MKIVVIGGTGLIGRPLVRQLRDAGDEVVAASPSTGVNTVTGEGLAEALAGAEVVVDIPNSPSFEDGAVLEFFESSTRNLVEEGTKAGIRHHVVLSIVGADRMTNIGYMRAKVAQENIVMAGGAAFSIVRATQFFEFIRALAEAGADGGTVRISPVLMQPVAAADVSAVLAGFAVGDPTNSTTELAGPDRLRLDVLARRVLGVANDPRTVVTTDDSVYFGGVVTDDMLVPGNDPRVVDRRLAPTHFDAWLAGMAAQH